LHRGTESRREEEDCRVHTGSWSRNALYAKVASLKRIPHSIGSQ